MQINTRDFGVVTVEEDAVYQFPEGLYGFEEDISFAIFNKTFDDVSFLYMQSTVNIIPCFLIFEPQDFIEDYAPLISTEDLKACKADSPDDLIFLAIANVPDSIEEMSLNIKSPVVLNPKTRQGRQIILQNQDYSIRYQPFLSGEEGGI
jgi:flagellar assembly factor FliW